MKTISQELAEYALQCIDGMLKSVKNDVVVAKKYKSYIKSFPALVISEGLLLALAFNFSKSDLNQSGESSNADKKARAYVFEHVSGWLIKKGIVRVEGNDDKVKAKKIIEKLSELKVREYRLATREALRISDWLKRLAEGLIEGEDNT